VGGVVRPFAAGRGVKYPARKLTVVTVNKRPTYVACEWLLSDDINVNLSCSNMPGRDAGVMPVSAIEEH
jgi:hypothetical protein